ncbi:hypothetical protein NKJ13_22990 [Mesorhizobium sp. M0174]|uniref:hypothetical protein n=1 Tax=Mesorhizobium sp. M0174 TaxID=2956904 RepID=UPI00333B95EF
MPELFAGLPRTPTTFPVQYKGANVPQAWAAGSCFSLLQAIIGFQPDAPNGKLYIDPRLPDWIDELTLNDLRLGKNRLELHFWRVGAETRWQVSDGDPSLLEARNCATGPNLRLACV